MPNALFRLFVAAGLMGLAAGIYITIKKVDNIMGLIDANEAILGERLKTIGEKVDGAIKELKTLREALENNPDVDLSDEVAVADGIIAMFAPEPTPDAPV